jgi:hypothetical protein
MTGPFSTPPISLRCLDRRSFIGGSDARVIMGSDEAALIRLWREKRGEADPEDLFGNLIVQLGAAAEELNRSWYEPNTGRRVTSSTASGTRLFPGWWRPSTASWREPKPYSKPNSCSPGHSPKRQRLISIITGGGKWVEVTTPMDPLYLSVLVSAEKKFWRCVQSGEAPHLINAEPPRPRIEAIRIVDMSASNSWAEFAALFRNTRSAFLDHERAKSELKALMPEDAKEAIGHGVKAKRSKSGAVSFDVLETEATHAPLQ